MSEIRTNEQLVLDALLAHQVRAAGGEVLRMGVCANCQAECAPLAVYCNADCRVGHELQLAVLAQHGAR